MSYDLYVLDVDDLPTDQDAIGDLLDDEEGWDAPLTDRLARFVAELEVSHPGLDEHPDDSPWASWPLTQSMVNGRCCAFNIVWSAAERMHPEFEAACRRHGLTLYDPQGGTVTKPVQEATDQDTGPGRRGRFWRRR